MEHFSISSNSAHTDLILSTFLSVKETIMLTESYPGPYCFHFSSGVTIPNPAGSHVADRGTTPRYEG